MAGILGKTCCCVNEIHHGILKCIVSYLNTFAICNCYSDTTVAVFHIPHSSCSVMTKKFTYGLSCLHVWQASLYNSMRIYNLNHFCDIVYILNILCNSFRSVVKLGIHRAVGITY